VIPGEGGSGPVPEVSCARTLAMPARNGEGFRPTTDAESRIVLALLEPDFPGRDAVAAQIQSAMVRVIDPEGSLEIVTTDELPADVARRIPVEAEIVDGDGITVHVLLHVVDGYVTELEIYRDDSGPLRNPIEPDGLKVIVF